jgi:inosine-uridine nucleoside N-ribohydrolase
MVVVLRQAGSLVVAVLAVAGLTTAAPPAVAAEHPTPVIYDGDMDVDDASTLAYLCAEDKQHRIDLLAATVDNDGFGTPGRAVVHARSVLDDCGLPEVPVAGGSDTVVHAAPADAVATVESVLTGALHDGADQPPPSTQDAAGLIRRTVAGAPGPVTVLTTGPLSNLAQALRSPGVTDRIQALYVMGGAIAVPGNLFGSALEGFDNTQELNMWLDPAAAAAVFRTMRPGTTHLVPLDATNHVPITSAFIDRLGADQQTVSARLVYAIMTQPDMTSRIAAGLYYWWDALTAVAAFRDDGGIVPFGGQRVEVVVTGPESGRTLPSATGVPLQAAWTADTAAFEQTFLTALNQGRRHPCSTRTGSRPHVALERTVLSALNESR